MPRPVAASHQDQAVLCAEVLAVNARSPREVALEVRVLKSTTMFAAGTTRTARLMLDQPLDPPPAPGQHVTLAWSYSDWMGPEGGGSSEQWWLRGPPYQCERPKRRPRAQPRRYQVSSPGGFSGAITYGGADHRPDSLDGLVSSRRPTVLVAQEPGPLGATREERVAALTDRLRGIHPDLGDSSVSAYDHGGYVGFEGTARATDPEYYALPLVVYFAAVHRDGVWITVTGSLAEGDRETWLERYRALTRSLAPWDSTH